MAREGRRLEKCAPAIGTWWRHGWPSNVMLPGVGGSLVGSAFLEDVLLAEFESGFAASIRSGPTVAELHRWWRRTEPRLGPASGARAVLDVAAIPLFNLLGYDINRLEPYRDGFVGTLSRDGALLAVIRTTLWGADAEAAWREVVRAGRVAEVRWGFVCTGRSLRIVDAARTWSRRALEFDLMVAAGDERSGRVLLALAASTALADSDDQS